MANLDDLLQERLTLLESAVPLNQILAGLPEEAAELAPLITLVAATRGLDHPAMQPQAVYAQQARVVAAGRSAGQRAPRPATLANRKSPLVLFGSLALVVLIVISTIGVSLALTRPAAAQASLADVNGLVEVAPNANSGEWHFVAAGETLLPGQRVRTYADSGVTLVFLDGTRTMIGADADLTLTTVNSGSGGLLQAKISQNAGETVYNVIPLVNGGYFEVTTPAGTVTVHGTNFNVAVSPDGEVLFAVTRGNVKVSQGSDNISLASGQAAAVLPGQDLEKPGYQFSLKGSITRIQGTQWVVDGVPFTIIPNTKILGTYQPGDLLTVRGRVLENGQWVADRVEPARKEDSKLHFTGILEQKGSIPGAWQIGGKTVQVNSATELAKDLKVGLAVDVSFVLLPDGGWLATEIESLDDEQENLTATPFTRTATATITATGTLTPTFTVTPTVTGTRISPTPTATGTLMTPTFIVTPTATVIPKNGTDRCDNRTEQQPEGLRLAQRFQVTYDEIMTWYCKGFGFGEIDLAYGLAKETGNPAGAIFSKRNSGLGWGEIKKNLAPQTTQETPKGGGNPNPQPQKTPKK